MPVTTLSQLEEVLHAGSCRCNPNERAVTYRRARKMVQCSKCMRALSVEFADSDGPQATTPASKSPLDYKSHFLIGLRADGAGILLQRWDYPPPRAEVDAQLAKVKRDDYLQFAVVNTTGFWDAVEKPEQPLWTARA